MNKSTVSVVGAVTALIGLVAASGEWLWTGFIVVLVAVLGLFEFIGVKVDGRTLTKRFKELKTGRKATITTGILGFIVWLMMHLWTDLL